MEPDREPEDFDAPEITVQARLLEGGDERETLAVIGGNRAAPPPEPAAPPEEPDSPRFNPPSARNGNPAGEAFAAALAEPDSPFAPADPFSSRPTPGPRPRSALAQVHDVSMKALLAIERAAEAVQRPDTARSLKEHKREIQNVLQLYSMDSEPEIERFDRPRPVPPMNETPRMNNFGQPHPPPQLDDPEMRYMVNDLKDLDRDRYAEAAALRDTMSSRSSSVLPEPMDEVRPSSRVSEASSAAILNAHVNYARNIRQRVRGDDPERVTEYTEEEANADKAYCQRIRRQLRYTFGANLDPIDEIGSSTPLPRLVAAPPDMAQPPYAPPPYAPPPADNWASQMLAELEVRPRPVYASAF